MKGNMYGRKTCPMCRGTGRVASYGYGNKKATSVTCSYCYGSGYVRAGK